MITKVIINNATRHKIKRKKVITINELKKVKTLTPAEAGKVLGKGAEAIRVGLRCGVFDFGSAIPPKKPGGKYNYIIIESKFLKYADEVGE